MKDIEKDEGKIEAFLIFSGLSLQFTAVILALATNPIAMLLWISGWGWQKWAEIRVIEKKNRG